ncbi:hypothetical protein FTUN_5940 [Frigoriglobus tundricola]|uniref:Transposase IS66 zinc-finger binding domain-containing protein n=1 Tax=Frigoriglobus tundricola TaxID=2774151 RepID=A0A6M5YZK4_9BACT|nr:hypothetical protein FTUN_5940 [Frigoriglobus tundricola]
MPGAQKPAPRRDPHGRSPLPEHLERREVIHDLTDAQKRCPCCGHPRECIGEQTAEQLDLEPVTFFVTRTIKKSRGERRRPTVRSRSRTKLQFGHGVEPWRT